MHRLIINENSLTILSNNGGKNWRVIADTTHEKTGIVYTLAWDGVQIVWDDIILGVDIPKLIEFLKENKPDLIGSPQVELHFPISEIELIEKESQL